MSNMNKYLLSLLSMLMVCFNASATEEGALNGTFTVNGSGGKVQFSQGNLQYQASTCTWRFAENQWDMIGDDNSNISASYTGWIDLFCWGTGNNPTNASTNISDYSTFTDWGVNAISNGGNQANQWRTLTKAEWGYLFQNRADAGNKYGAAKVNGITGVVLLPDNWTLPSDCGFTAGMTSASSWSDWSLVASTNIYDAVHWSEMEKAGAVFLPAAGSRDGTEVGYVGLSGRYWSATVYNTNYAYRLYYYSDRINPKGFDGDRDSGRSVRLVRTHIPDANPTAIENTLAGQTQPATQKILRDGQIYILRGEKVYTLTGKEIK